jgi:Transposase, Mutator family
VPLAVPRDRVSTFEPRLVPKGARRVGGGLDEIIISLYAGGMTVRDIGHHLHRTLGVELSHDTIWQDHRRGGRGGQGLAAPAAGPGLPDHLDLRPGGEGPRRRARGEQVRPRRAGRGHRRDQARARHLGVQSGEGAKFWLGVLSPAAQPRRGRCADRLLRRLEGLPEAIETVWPATVAQTCVVHYADLRAMLMWSRIPLQDNGFVLPRTAKSGELIDACLSIVERRASWSRCRGRSCVGRWSRTLHVRRRAASAGLFPVLGRATRVLVNVVIRGLGTGAVSPSC